MNSHASDLLRKHGYESLARVMELDCTNCPLYNMMKSLGPNDLCICDLPLERLWEGAK